MTVMRSGVGMVVSETHDLEGSAALPLEPMQGDADGLRHLHTV